VTIPGGGNGIFQIGEGGQVQHPGHGHGQGVINIPGLGQGQGVGLGQGNTPVYGLDLKPVNAQAQSLKLDQTAVPTLDLTRIQAHPEPMPYRMKSLNIGMPKFPTMDFTPPRRPKTHNSLDLFGSQKRVHPIAEPGVWFKSPFKAPGAKRRKSKR